MRAIIYLNRTLWTLAGICLLVYGVGRRPTHRAVFTVRSDLVLVLRVRHLAQKEISPDD